MDVQKLTKISNTCQSVDNLYLKWFLNGQPLQNFNKLTHTVHFTYMYKIQRAHVSCPDLQKKHIGAKA